ncbi:MAG: FIST C-terminal domain-containing protein [Bacteroidota bacterium]|nr:FIST C-terminal domain-containing protein [Bacteroidota bacterium]
MITSAAVFTREKESVDAATDLCRQIKSIFINQAPQVIILFASPYYEQHVLLKNLRKEFPSAIQLGCSSAGEFTSDEAGVDSASAMAIHSTDMLFNASIGKGIRDSRNGVVDQLMKSLKGSENFKYKYHTALILADALSGHTDEIIDKLTERTAGLYQFFGGGAGDNANFKKTPVFYDTDVVEDAIVFLEILSNKPLGLGVSHGWHPTGNLYRVTEVKGMVLNSLNGIPALEVFRDHARDTGQLFDVNNPIPFFLHNVIGIKKDDGYKLRVPLAVSEDGSIVCASDIPLGGIVSIMSTKNSGSINAAENATRKAIAQLQGNKPVIGLFFDCVATRLRLGDDFDTEIETVITTFNDAKVVGCNTHGQVARIDGQFSGFHNCTAVVCIIPE